MAITGSRGIVWIASYPKSGNTWFRAFLTNLLRGGTKPASINELAAPFASDREKIDSGSGLETSRLTPDEMDTLRPDVYRTMAARSPERIYLKVHDAFRQLPGGQYLLPPDASAAVVYIIRNPLDVAVSMAHFMNVAFEQGVDIINDSQSCGARQRYSLSSQVQQQLLSWSDHVRSWVDQHEIPVRTFRYEDLLCCPSKGFGEAASFLGLQESPEEVEQAVIHSRFDELKKQEGFAGFKESIPCAQGFFRQGKTGQWRDALSRDQVRRVVEAHGQVMRRFGYLNSRGEPGDEVWPGTRTFL